MIALAESVAQTADAASRFRAWRRLAGMAALLLVFVPLHYLWRAFRLRSPWPRLYLRSAGWAAGARVRLTGTPLARDVLVVSNHVSCLDILLIAGATGVRFVSKSEVERWPFVGWLASLNRTVYVARTERGRVHEQAERLHAAIAEGDPVALFPEGGTGDGSTLGPFRASLLAAMTPPPPGVLLQPMVIDYGREMPLVAWNADTGIADETWRLLKMPGRRQVTIRMLDPIDPLAVADRKVLAAQARAAMIGALGGSVPERL